jgi:hypothetical protein
MNNTLKYLAIAMLISWAAWTVVPMVDGTMLQTKDGVSELMIGKPAGTAQYALRILFIGNSYTYYNDMPRQLALIAASDPANQIEFTIQSVARGGITLQELWDDGRARELLRNQHWDYVVLQQQSFWAMSPASIIETLKLIRVFDQEIKAAGAHTLIFTTWARKPGSSWYSDKKTATFLRSPEYMQKQFSMHTQDIAARVGATAIPVGEYWAYATSAYPDIDLYLVDGTHPSAAGAYLTALAFYRYFSGHAPTQVTYHPGEISTDDATKLRSVVP